MITLNLSISVLTKVADSHDRVTLLLTPALLSANTRGPRCLESRLSLNVSVTCNNVFVPLSQLS